MASRNWELKATNYNTPTCMFEVRSRASLRSLPPPQVSSHALPSGRPRSLRFRAAVLEYR